MYQSIRDMQLSILHAYFDMKNSADQGGCYPQRPKAEVDN